MTSSEEGLDLVRDEHRRRHRKGEKGKGEKGKGEKGTCDKGKGDMGKGDKGKGEEGKGCGQASPTVVEQADADAPTTQEEQHDDNVKHKQHLFEWRRGREETRAPTSRAEQKSWSTQASAASSSRSSSSAAAPAASAAAHAAAPAVAGNSQGGQVVPPRRSTLESYFGIQTRGAGPTTTRGE